MAKDAVEQRVEKICGPMARDLGLQVVLVQYRRESNGWILRVLVDRPEGTVSVEDCSSLSRELSDVLDIEDPIDVPYNLEVSSPGLDRPLVSREDFERFAGRQATIKMRNPVYGRRNFKGTLAGIEQDTFTVIVDGQRYELNVQEVKKANLVPVLEGRFSSGAD